MKSILFEEIIVEMTNQKIKYWTGITIDPNSKKFKEDLLELSNIILSVEYTNGTKSKKNYIDSTVNELTRKTIKNLINELLIYKENKQMYVNPIMHTNIDISELNNNELYQVPEYFGCDELQNNNQEKLVEKKNTKVVFEEKTSNYEIDLEECDYKNNSYIYIFSTPLEEIKSFKIKHLSLSKSDFNITNSNNSLSINGTNVILSEGNYESINDILNEISTKIRNEFGEQILVELNKITNKFSFKIAPVKINTNSTIMKQTMKQQTTLNYEIVFDSSLNKILGFENEKYTLKSILVAENMYKMIYKNMSFK
jgi:hypothetical protein